MAGTEQVVIEKIVAGGAGLGHLPDGRAVFAPFTLPGEEVVLRLSRRHKQHAEAEAVRIVSPAPQRRQPPCPLFGTCGGCDLQHAVYPKQLEIKEAILREILARAGISGAGRDFLLSVAPAPEEFGYRQRIRLQVSDDGSPGFYRPRSHEVVPITTCPLAAPAINRVFAILRREPAARQLLAQATAVELVLNLEQHETELAGPEQDKVVVLLHSRRPLRAADRQRAADLCASQASIQGILFAVPDKAMGPAITRETGPAGSMDLSALHIRFTIPAAVAGQALTLEVEPGGFSQVNPRQNEKMIATLLGWLALTGSGKVLDLFCGMGNFSLPLALHAGSVLGMDLQGAAIRRAVSNAAGNNLGNCTFARKGAEQGARELAAAGERFDVLLLDPPRAGCREVIPHLAALDVAQIACISCDPATLARDLVLLCDQGYAIERMQLFDMFPQTRHLETMTLLRRQGRGEAA